MTRRKVELNLSYSANLGGILKQFAADYPSKEWKHFVRLNRESIVVAAVPKGL